MRKGLPGDYLVAVNVIKFAQIMAFNKQITNQAVWCKELERDFSLVSIFQMHIANPQYI
jgi:hypothetical protein